MIKQISMATFTFQRYNQHIQAELKICGLIITWRYLAPVEIITAGADAQKISERATSGYNDSFENGDFDKAIFAYKTRQYIMEYARKQHTFSEMTIVWDEKVYLQISP